MTALFSPARKNFAPGLGSHTFEKVVHAFAPAIVRLIGPLHDVLFGEVLCPHTLAADSP